MTDNEIIKALKEVLELMCNEGYLQRSATIREVLDLINRQKAEIERLRKQLYLAECCIDEVEDALYRGSGNDWAEQAVEEYNKLVKEMVGDENG